ncbi:MAG: 2Fe-2S iron-sulfur cluster binding domain-containing protein [Dehalococcoidia bacterium]|nr:2Fe-2S iron-sulfur cluster binding domain-containing protein [Dehalococcoidia bacterium]
MAKLLVNGQSFETSDEQRNLLSYLRYELRLLGTRYGCGEGLCGSCTVLADGLAIRSCQATVGSVAGQALTTIEGLASDDRLHPVQQAFLDEHAMQCGYCTSGWIMSIVGLLERDAKPSPEDIRDALGENLCRCGVYPRIERAIDSASKAMQGRQP